jgi:hypothetical protein
LTTSLRTTTMPSTTGGSGTLVLALLAVLVLICVCRSSRRGGAEGFANFLSLSDSLTDPCNGSSDTVAVGGGAGGGAGTCASLRDGDDPALRALRAQRAAFACNRATVGNEAEGLPRYLSPCIGSADPLADVSCSRRSRSGDFPELGSGRRTAEGEPAYRFPCWGAFGEIPEPGLAGSETLPPQAGVDFGPLEYSHYQGLPANWAIPSLMKLESRGAGHSVSTNVYDPSPFGAEVSKNGNPRLDNPSVLYDAVESPDAVPYEYSHAADGKPSWYRVLQDPDHEPYMGSMSYST